MITVSIVDFTRVGGYDTIIDASQMGVRHVNVLIVIVRVLWVIQILLKSATEYN